MSQNNNKHKWEVRWNDTGALHDGFTKIAKKWRSKPKVGEGWYAGGQIFDIVRVEGNKVFFEARNTFSHDTNECDGGGCVASAPAPTLNIASACPMGNAMPASQAAMTGAEQTDPNSYGSGDKWGGDYKKNKKKKLKFVVARKTDDGIKVIRTVESVTDGLDFIKQNKFDTETDNVHIYRLNKM